MTNAPVKISLRELADQASRATAEHPVMRDRQRTSIELRPDVHKEAYDRDSEARMVFARSVLKAAGVTLESDKQRVLFEQHIRQTIYPESDFELWLAGWKAAASTRDRPAAPPAAAKKKTGPVRGRPGTHTHCLLSVLHARGPLARQEIFTAMKEAGSTVANIDALSVLLSRGVQLGELKHLPDGRWTLAAPSEGWVRPTGSGMPEGITSDTLLHVELVGGHMRSFCKAGDVAWSPQASNGVTWYCVLTWNKHAGRGMPAGLHASQKVAVRLRDGSVSVGAVTLFNWTHNGDQATDVMEYTA